VATALPKSGVTHVRLFLLGRNAGAKREAIDLSLLPLHFFFCVFSPKIACQAPKPPNYHKAKGIELAR
jgi:hypothetical protein